MFEYKLLPRFDLKPDTGPEGYRIYNTPQGAFPSVTTVLKSHFGTEKLDEWRKRVGEEESNAVSQQATNRGNEVHLIFEKYIKGDLDWKKGKMPTNLETFNKAKYFIDRNKVIYGSEYTLYSPILKAAGTIDLVSKYEAGDGIDFNAITDFKTSKRRIDKSWDKWLSYQFQATTYAMMIEEWFNLVVPFNAIVVMIPHEFPQIIIEKNDNYRSKVVEIFEQFHVKSKQT